MQHTSGARPGDQPGSPAHTHHCAAPGPRLCAAPAALHRRLLCALQPCPPGAENSLRLTWRVSLALGAGQLGGVGGNQKGREYPKGEGEYTKSREGQCMASGG